MIIHNGKQYFSKNFLRGYGVTLFVMGVVVGFMLGLLI